MARRYSHRPLFPNPVVSFFLFWLGYILNGSTLPPSVTFCTARYGDATYLSERRIVDRRLSSTYLQHRREGVAILNILNLVKQTEGLRESLREFSNRTAAKSCPGKCSSRIARHSIWDRGAQGVHTNFDIG